MVRRNAAAGRGSQPVRRGVTPDIQELFEDPDFYIIDELTQKIEKAILNLPESYRIAFEMHRFQNKTYQEIAEELNISSKTVDYRIQQALKQLRKELKDYLPLLLFFFVALGIEALQK